MLKAVLLPALFVAAFSLTSCKKESLEPTKYPELQMLPGKYKRIVTLQDGGSTVTLGIAADNDAQLDDFEVNVVLKGLTALPETEPIDIAINNEVLDAPDLGAIDSEAVHICILEEKKGAGIVGFELQVNTKTLLGKIGTSGNYSGMKVFYSWEAPHYFRVNSVVYYCVDTWLYRVPNSTPNWTWVNYFHLCQSANHTWQFSSNAYDYRLIANGPLYHVQWY